MAAEAGAAGAQILLAAVDLGVYDDGVDGIVHPGGLITLTAAEVRYTTGAYDRELVLPDGDRPGVMLAGGGRRLLIRERTMPGTRALIVEVAGRGAEIAGLLLGAGVDVVARCAPSDVRAIHGREAVESVELTDGRRRRPRRDRRWGAAGGRGRSPGRHPGGAAARSGSPWRGY